MCIRAVDAGLGLLGYVPDWFVTQEKLKIWHDDDEYCNDDEFIEWYNGYQKRKAQKAKIKEELTHHLASQSCDRLVHVRRQKGAMEVTDNLFYKLSDTKMTVSGYILIFTWPKDIK